MLLLTDKSLEFIMILKSFNIIMNSNDLSELVRRELIVKKCLSLLLDGMGLSLISEMNYYRIHVVYRKTFRYIFKLLVWAHLSELLGIF